MEVVSGGVDEWVVKEYKGRGVGGEGEEGYRKMELIISLARLYQPLEEQQQHHQQSQPKRPLLLKGFHLSPEFFRRLKTSQFIPFAEIDSIDLRDTSLSITPPPTPTSIPMQPTTFLDLSFLSLCCPKTLSSLFLPPDFLSSSLSIPSTLSPSQILEVLEVAKEVVPQQPQEQPKTVIDLSDISLSKVGVWVLEGLVEWEGVKELRMGENKRRKEEKKKKEKREGEEEKTWGFVGVPPFFGRLEKEGEVMVGRGWEGEEGEEKRKLEEGVVQRMRGVGRVVRSYPNVDLSGLGERHLIFFSFYFF